MINNKSYQILLIPNDTDNFPRQDLATDYPRFDMRGTEISDVNVIKRAGPPRQEGKNKESMQKNRI